MGLETALLIGGAALAAAGAGVSTYSAQDTARKQEHAVSDELARQGQYSKKAQAVANASIQGSGVEKARQQMAEGVKKQQALYSQVAPAALDPNSPAVLTPTTLDSDRVAAATALNAASRAPLAGYDEFNLQQQIKNLHAAQQLGVISRMAGTSAGVLPLEVQSAQQSDVGLNDWATVLQSLGGLASAGGLATAKKPPTPDGNNLPFYAY